MSNKNSPYGSGPVVLVADDQADVRAALRQLLKLEGLSSFGAGSPAEVVEAVRHQEFACALIDCNYSRDTTSGIEGLQLLEQLRELAPGLPVIAMTAWGNIPLAVKAMRCGAVDFIEKPWDNQRVLEVLQAQITLGPNVSRGRLRDAKAGMTADIVGPELIAESVVMQRVLTLIDRIAPSDAHVLVLGENGTGKGVIAQRIHQRSARATGPLVKVNMGGIAESVFESEMFGHVSGAYTDAKGARVGRFELADKGTLFLDEVGNIPASQQPKLLRVLEDGEFERLGSSQTQRVNVRLVSATNADLPSEVAAGRFRKDLFYRLNTMEVLLPPLRDRHEDIVPLARSFLYRSGLRYGRANLRLSSSCERALEAWSWPGNVRELQHLMERAALLADTDQIEASALAFGSKQDLVHDLEHMTLEHAELWLLKRGLERYDGNILQAAEALGITRQSMYRRLQKHDLNVLSEHDDTK